MKAEILALQTRASTVNASTKTETTTASADQDTPDNDVKHAIHAVLTRVKMVVNA